MSKDSVIDLYERWAGAYDRDRSRSLQERAWLDRFLACIPRGGVVLDVGCGMGEPIARYVLEGGFRVHGVDASPSMVQLCRARFPASEWVVADMRELELGGRFDGIVAWDSFFHLSREDQRGMFRTFATHAKPGAPLLFTSGPAAGEAIGSYCGGPLYHASLDAAEYERLLDIHGFRVQAHEVEDASCGGHTVWLAVFGSAPAPAATMIPRPNNRLQGMRAAHDRLEWRKLAQPPSTPEAWVVRPHKSLAVWISSATGAGMD